MAENPHILLYALQIPDIKLLLFQTDLLLSQLFFLCVTLQRIVQDTQNQQQKQKGNHGVAVV